jgi:hypothetical protein
MSFRYILARRTTGAGVERWDTGEETTAFAAKSSSTAARLSSTLAHRIADYVIDALNVMPLSTPLVSIELAYRVTDRYLPTAIAYTVEDKVESYPVLSPIATDHMIDLPAGRFEPEMAELMGRMSSKGDWTAGTKMLRHAARLLSNADHRIFLRVCDRLGARRRRLRSNLKGMSQSAGLASARTSR